jgi:uncharacterized protein (TIGR00725 family)
MLNYIAILGFAQSCPERNQAIAFKAGQEIVNLGFGIAAGNLLGTPMHAFNGAKDCHGTTLAIIEQSIDYHSHQNCDILQVVPSNAMKHQMLAELCSGALVIGGGTGTLNVIHKFLAQSKPVVAIENTGGITRNELRWAKLNNKVMLYPTLQSAIRHQLQFWPIQHQEYG